MPKDEKMENIFQVKRIAENKVHIGALNYSVSLDQVANLAAHLVLAAEVSARNFDELVADIADQAHLDSSS